MRSTTSIQRTRFRDIVRPSDWLFAGGCLVLAGLAALGLHTFNSMGDTVVFRQSGKIVQTVPLGDDTEVTLQGKYTNEFVIRDGQVYCAYTDCPNQQCVHSGHISAAGASIICVPNEVSVSIERKGKKSEIDAYTG